jgi:hypothetical protein
MNLSVCLIAYRSAPGSTASAATAAADVVSREYATMSCDTLVLEEEPIIAMIESKKYEYAAIIRYTCEAEYSLQFWTYTSCWFSVD